MLEQLRRLLGKEVGEYLHRYIHYDVKVSMALLFTQDEAAEGLIREHIRPTDKALKVSKHLFVIFYQYTETDEEAESAVRNLENRLSEKSKTLIAYTTFHDSDKDPDTVITRLYHIFEDLFSKSKGEIRSDADYFRELEKFSLNLDEL